jgi:zinc/manganese transport system substrate-binding protein
MIRLLTLAAVSGLALTGAAAAQDGPSVVASFSILGDMVREVGGDHVAVTTLVGPNGDAHVYEPTPADAQALGAADLLVVNGLHFEGWMDRLVESVGYAGPVVVATDGIVPLTMDEEAGHEEDGAEEHAHGELNPHAWHDLRDAAVYVDNIARGLEAVDPAHAADYAANAERYKGEILALDAEIRTRFAALPEDRRRVLTSHDAFGYFGAAYGVTFLAPVGLSTESEASAQEVARMIDQVRADAVSAVFVENITDGRLMTQIAEETGATVGGTLYSDALSEPGQPAATFLDMVRYDADTIASAIEAAEVAEGR